jgi:putative nucleotidyltransferase with HDIG domain
MSNRTRLRIYVAGVALAAIAAVLLLSLRGEPFPGGWALFLFLVSGILLEVSSLQPKVGGGAGSISFVVDLSAPIVFGGLWSCLISGTCAAVTQVVRRTEPIRFGFNVAERVLRVAIAFGVYTALGGRVPPSILVNASATPFNHLLGELLIFFTAAFAYFLANSLAVSVAVALSNGRSIRSVWRANTLFMLGYDIAASVFSLAAAWAYLSLNVETGLSRLVPIAVIAAIAIIRHVWSKLNTLQHLYVELDQAYDKLEQALREQLETMVKSIEARDPYTSGHSRRVAALSKAIAVDLGLEPAEVEDIETSALLHDVGKIHAEFAPLLQKEGRLTQEEWEIMKTHAVRSAELVGLFSRFHGKVQNYVRSHHERWDGKGYPDGIVAEGIPLGARIIMISDTIDAMTTDRPYRKALPFDRVVAELQKYQGAQFDPYLVDVTINSVTVRRLVFDKEFLAEQTTSGRTPVRAKSRPALRSQSNFLDAIRAASPSGPVG